MVPKGGFKRRVRELWGLFGWLWGSSKEGTGSCGHLYMGSKCMCEGWVRAWPRKDDLCFLLFLTVAWWQYRAGNKTECFISAVGGDMYTVHCSKYIDTSVMLKQYYFSNFQFSLFYFGFHYFTSHIYNIHIHYMSRFSPWQWKVLIYLACGECSRWSLVSLCLLPALTNHSLLQQRFLAVCTLF